MKLFNYEISPEAFRQFMKYGCIGVLNTLLMAGIFNLLIFITGITTGGMVVLFSFITFCIVLVQSFFLNKIWVFKQNEGSTHRRFLNFFLVSASVALINLGVVHLIVNVIGAPTGISTHVWANVAILVTIFVSVIGNFTGYKLIVFK